MVLINGIKYACETCIRGHRSSSCSHLQRQLFEIKRKGRPVSQCDDCRELRKTKKIHVKCICAKPDREEEQSVSEKILLNLEKNTKGLTKNEKFAVTSLLNPCRCSEGFLCTCCSVSEGFYSNFIDAGIDPEAIRAALKSANSCSSSCKACGTGCGSRAEAKVKANPTGSDGNVKSLTRGGGGCCSSKKSKDPSTIQSSATPPVKLDVKTNSNNNSNDKTNIGSTEPSGCCSSKKKPSQTPSTQSPSKTSSSKELERARLITSLQHSTRKQERNHKLALESLMNPCRCGEGYTCTCFSIPDKYDFYAEFDGTGVDTEALKLSLQCGSSCGANCESCSTKCCGNSQKQNVTTKSIDIVKRSPPKSTSHPNTQTGEKSASLLADAGSKSDEIHLTNKPDLTRNNSNEASISRKGGLKRSAASANLDGVGTEDDGELIQMVYNSVSVSKTCCQPQDNTDRANTGESIATSTKGCCSKEMTEKQENSVEVSTSGSCCASGACSGNCACCFDPENPTFYVDTDGVRTCGCGCNKPASDCSHCLKDLCEEIILKPPSSCRTTHSHSK